MVNLALEDQQTVAKVREAEEGLLLEQFLMAEDFWNLKSPLSSVGTSFPSHPFAQIVFSVGFRWEEMGVDGREPPLISALSSLVSMHARHPPTVDVHFTF